MKMNENVTDETSVKGRILGCNQYAATTYVLAVYKYINISNLLICL